MTVDTARRPSAVAPNLAANGTGFLVRRKEMAKVSALLDRARLVTLAGPPGIGKSLLALEVAAERSDGQSSDVASVELAAVGDSALVPAAVAAALAVQEVPGESLADTILARVGDRRLVLVLDNCEHLLLACSKLAEALLEGCRGLTILATSREPLASPGELVWRVPPLSLPDRSEPCPPERLMDYDAVRLFVERARGVEPRFALNDHTAPAVVEICRRLDGIPLPIELAAARVESLTPAEIARRLDHRFNLLTNGNGVEPSRNRPLETAIERSYRLLSEPERALLRRLAVFAGGFELKAAAAVGEGGEVTAAAVPGLVERLVAKSLVAYDAGARRLRLLETIRAYVGERLEQSGEARAARQAHARFYTALAEAAEPELTGPAQRRCFERLEAERANLRSAFEWAVSQGRGEWALRLTGALVLFWQIRGHCSEGRELLAAALAASDGAPADLSAKARWGEGFLLLMSGDSDGAIPLLEDCLERFRERGDIHGHARALLVLGSCRQLRDDPSGLTLVEESAVLARETGDSWCLATALSVAGFEYCDRYELAAARPLFEECLMVARAAGDRHGLHVGLAGLGRVALGEGDHRSAEPLFEECMTVAEEMGELYAKATATGYLADAAFMRGDYARARELLDAALPLLRRRGPLVPALVMWARVARAEGQRAEARGLSEEAVRLARMGAGDLARALHGMGELAAEEGNRATARRLFEEALELARASHGRLGAARALHGLGELAREEGDGKRATVLHKDALKLHREIGRRPGMVASLEAVAALTVHAGRYGQAARLLAAAQRARDENGYARAPREQARHEQSLALARDALSGEEFESASRRGAALSIEEAAAEALDTAVPFTVKPRRWSSLTESEQEVAALAAQGLTNPEIARQLFISVAAVKARLLGVFSKLGVTRRSELVREFARIEQEPPDSGSRGSLGTP